MSTEATPTPTTPPPATANPGTAAGTATAAAAQPGSQPAVNQPAAPATVTIPLEQLTAFTTMQTRLAQVEAENRQREQAAQQEQAAILAKKGEIENAFDLLRKSSEKELAGARADKSIIEERAKRYALDGEISRVLTGHPLVPGAAAQLTKLLRTEFNVEPEGDSFAVRTPKFVSVTDHVAALLASPEYSHFIRASNPSGGTGGVNPAGQASPTPPAQTAPVEQPKTMSEALILDFANMAKRAPSDGRLNMGAAIGLRRQSQQQG